MLVELFFGALRFVGEHWTYPVAVAGIVAFTKSTGKIKGKNLVYLAIGLGLLFALGEQWVLTGGGSIADLLSGDMLYAILISGIVYGGLPAGVHMEIRSAFKLPQ